MSAKRGRATATQRKLLEAESAGIRRPARRDANTAATRDAIVAAGRAVFAEHGYSSAALEEIVRAAGVTTGALYHHFRNKRDLFVAVAESVEQEILDELAARDDASASVWSRLEQGLSATLEISARPDIQRIIHRDAPTVVGMREWREVEIRYGFGVLQQMLGSLARSGELVSESADLAAQILLGALMEAAHAVVLAPNKDQALRDANLTLLAFLRSLHRTSRR